MAAIRNIETGEITVVDQTPTHVHGVWECGNMRFTDPSKDIFEAVETFAPTMSVVDFWELFTVQEETLIRQKATTEPIIATWLRRLDDQRTVSVNITLPAVVSAITYVATDIPLAAGRLDTILAGIPA